MGNKKVNYISVGLFSLLALLLNVAQAEMDDVRLHIPIELLDEAGVSVLTSGKPYSSKQSCGGSCHDYESITHAFHIEQGRDEARDDFGVKRGMSNLVGPGYFGGYNCMGGNNPDQLAKKDNASADDFADMGSAGWVKRCTGCHTGGGWMEKDRHGRRYDSVNPESVAQFDGDYYNRSTDEDGNSVVRRWDWKKSGVIENDCLLCHVDLNALKAFGEQPIITSHGTVVVDPAPLTLFNAVRRTEFVNNDFFRYANTAILNYINLNLSGDSLLDKSVVSFERDAGVLVKDENGLPKLIWNNVAFNDGDTEANPEIKPELKGKVEIPMLRFPGNDNCMMCHRTSNSRRGFYGFGEGAEAVYDEDGMPIEDYRDDVHKGNTWIEANGEVRQIENCNACHARNYFNRSSSTADVNANHNFLKGNSDMDVRNDLDYAPGAKTCEYCHDNAENKEALTAKNGMLSAHLKKWEFKFNTSNKETLTRITKAHLDVVSCQACHITNKKDRNGNPIQLLYRYREGEDGKRQITPYKPKSRYFWRDKNSGRVLNKTERNSVFKLVETGTDPYGIIIDPLTEKELARVTARMSHGSWAFGDPATYVDFIALKNAYDKLMIAKGVSQPDMVLVWAEPNAYLISHNTSLGIDSLQCGDCHDLKQDGITYSALVSDKGVLGKANIKTVTQLLDRRQVTEGLVVLDLPYMKMDATGLVTENVADILYATRVDPSMTILKSGSAKVAEGELTCAATDETLNATAVSEIDKAKLAELLNNSYAGDSTACSGLNGETPAVFQFQPRHGDTSVRGISLMTKVGSQTEWLAQSRSEVAIAGETVAKAANDAGMGGLVSDVFSLEITDKNRAKISSFSSPMLVKLPYTGSNTNRDEIKLITSTDGSNWTAVNADNIVALRAQSEEATGYVAFQTNHFSYYALVDSTVSVDGSESEATTAASSGGGCTVHRHTPFDPLLPMLIAISIVYLWRRRMVQS